MAAALSLDLRERVIAAVQAGASCRQAAKREAVRRRQGECDPLARPLQGRRLGQAEDPAAHRGSPHRPGLMGGHT